MKFLKINRTIINLILVSTLIGCSKGNQANISAGPSIPNIEPTPTPILFPRIAISTLQSNYNNFVGYGLAITNTNMANTIPMSFKSLGYTVAYGGHIGQCLISPDNSRAMFFDPLFWSGASDAQREMVVFHELAHCLENRVHIVTTNSKGNASSIMTPFLLDENIYTADHDAYIAELYTHTILFDPSAPTLGPGSAGESEHFLSYDPENGTYCDHE